MKSIAERLLKGSPRKELLDKINDLAEAIKEQSGDDAKSKAEQRYRIVMSELLLLICLSLERLFFLFGLVFGVLLLLKLR